MKHAPEILFIIVLVAVCVLVAIKLFSALAKKITVWEYEKALLYNDGKLEKVLPSGALLDLPVLALTWSEWTCVKEP